MKKVFTNSSDVIHLFAQQTQSEGRCSNVFFYNKKIYSYGYHYLLGDIIENKKGAEAIVINDTGYSVTTAKHVREIIQATRQYKQFFTTETDLKHVVYTIEQNITKLQNARKPELYIEPSKALFKKLTEFIEWSDNKAMKKHENYKKIVALMQVIEGNREYYDTYLRKQKSRIAREKAKQDKARALKLANDIKDFETYETNRVWNSNEDYLRLSKDGQTVETSQEITVSLKEAKMLYKCIVEGKEVRGYEIAGYKVKALNGTLTIGCHNINLESMHKVGKLITN